MYLNIPNLLVETVQVVLARKPIHGLPRSQKQNTKLQTSFAVTQMPTLGPQRAGRKFGGAGFYAGQVKEGLKTPLRGEVTESFPPAPQGPPLLAADSLVPTYPRSAPQLQTRGFQCVSIITDCGDVSSFSLIKQTKKRISMKICKYCN